MALYPYKCVRYLMENDEVIWKLLKYSTPDAWSKPNLTIEEKAKLVYNGDDNTVDFRVFLDGGQPDVNTFENCQIRISRHQLYPKNRVVGNVSMLFEVYTHYKNNHLSNYMTRNDLVMERIIQVFNGKAIGGIDSIGKLFMDRMASDIDRLENAGQLPYKGSWLIMSNKSK